MKNKISLLFICFFCLLSNTMLEAQTKTNHEQLKENARLAEFQFKRTQIEVKKKAKQRNLQLKGYDQKGRYFWLHHFDSNDNPVYYGIRNNAASASTIRASRLWNNGGAGLNLEGQSMEVSTTRARLGMWEPGVARLTHVEFGGRLTMRDGTTFSGDNGDNQHATHVAGTMIASGVNAIAKGMSPQAKMDGYDANNDLAEMSTAGSEGMLLSNHSYGQNLPSPGQAQDIARGRYDSEAKSWDDLCVAAPFYLPVQACGNDRDDTSPNMTYDLLLGSSTAKNTLGIGACQVLTNPYSQPSDVIMASFSSYGPTDDGRIKPDLVAPGVAITSSVSSGDNNYAAEDGTSMAGPAAASALFLVQQHYKNLNNGSFMRAATLRGLAIHTAEEAGTTPGPDYGFGWGLLNVEKCVQVVSNTSQTHLLTQESLNNGATFTRQITVAGGQPLKVTICWADLGATPLAETAANINNRTSRLVNDLDLRILDANSNVITDLPWKLNPNTPAAAATKGDNLVDNIERIDVTSLAAGTYTIRVTHKGTLANAQAFSLIVTGIVAPSVAPTITSFTPSSGAVGTNVTITGTNFTGASVVSFNNVNATTFNVVSATSITATVPTSATTGKVRVTTANGTAVSTNDFTVTTPTSPTITSFTPSSGAVGTNVTITGTNFTGANVVSFNNVNATTFNVVSATSITATVPTSATTGKVRITTANGTAVSTNDFTVTTPTPAPTITSFTPAIGVVGTNVTITGTDFTGASVVSFNNVNATSFNVVSATSITATVPTGTTTGKVRVTTANGTAVSTNDFVIDPNSLESLKVQGISVYPNPTTEIINVIALKGKVGTKVILYDLQGRIIKSQSFRESNEGVETSFNVKELSDGQYLIQIEGIKEVVRVIKK